MRASYSQANNNAFVNVFVEMREPGRDGGTGKTILSSGGAQGVWDHLIVWHCSFPYKNWNLSSDIFGYRFTNSSFIGNLFYELRESLIGVGNEIPYALPGNTEQNEFLHNHYTWSCVDQGNCGWSEPFFHSKSPDSDPSISQSIGDPKIDLTDPSSSSFGLPLDGSVLIDRIPFATVPVDVLGNPRDQKPDVGAMERTSGQSLLLPPADFQKQ